MFDYSDDDTNRVAIKTVLIHAQSQCDVPSGSSFFWAGVNLFGHAF